MDYKIVISRRDSIDTPVAEIQNEAINLSWEYDRIGGCGAFQFSILSKLFKDTKMELDSNVKIYLKESGTYTLRYQGKIQSKNYQVGTEETVEVQGFGYQVELQNIYVDRNYSSTEISLIAVNVLDNDITPNTNISYNPSTGIDATSFTPDSLEFNNTADNVFQTLAEVVGTREWGVDASRNLYFKTRSTTAGFQIPMGSYVQTASYDVSSKDIINRVVVIGGDVAGSPFTRTINDTTSQLKWKRRDVVIQNSAIVTNNVADQFGASKLAESAIIGRRVNITCVANTIWESTVPIDLVQMKTDVDKYGSKKFGEGLYNSLVNLRVNRIMYSIDENGVMSSSLELGQLRPDISENISQLENKIQHLLAVGV